MARKAPVGNLLSVWTLPDELELPMVLPECCVVGSTVTITAGAPVGVPTAVTVDVGAARAETTINGPIV